MDLSPRMDCLSSDTSYVHPIFLPPLGFRPFSFFHLDAENITCKRNLAALAWGGEGNTN